VILEQPGIYKARVTGWGLGEQSKESQSVPVVLDFAIVSRFEGGDVWDDWTQYEEQTITGYFYVVGRDGKVLADTVERLARALGWNGEPSALVGPPPEVIVQITVEQETYEGKARLKVKWINPENYTPGTRVQDAQGVQQFRTQFGSQMRAAATAALKAQQSVQAPAKGVPPVRAARPPQPEPPPAVAAAADDDNDLPF